MVAVVFGRTAAAVILCTALAAACDLAGPATEEVLNDAPIEAAEPTLPEARARLEGMSLRRNEDLRAIKAALDSYSAEHEGKYPVAKAYQGFASDWGPSLGDAWIPELLPKYIQPLPKDPAGSATASGPMYLYRSDGTDFKLIAHASGDCSTAVEVGGVKIDPKRSDSEKCWAYGFWTANAAQF